MLKRFKRNHFDFSSFLESSFTWIVATAVCLFVYAAGQVVGSYFIWESPITDGISKTQISFNIESELLKLEEDKKKFLSKKYPFEKAAIQMQYLNKISILCKEKNANLILLNTPKHIFYLQHMDKEMNEFWQNYSRNEIKDSILDYSSFELPDSCYSDLGHLNYRGARVFSEDLNRYIKVNDN
jgi:hypothetical protein